MPNLGSLPSRPLAPSGGRRRWNLGGWRCWFGLVALSVGAVSVRAQLVPAALVAPADPVVAGQSVSLQLLVTNASAAAATWSQPTNQSGTLVSGTQRISVQLLGSGEGSDVPVPAGGFLTRSYHFVVPAQMVGRAVLEVAQATGPVLRTVLDIAPAATSEPAPASTGVAATAAPAPAPVVGPNPDGSGGTTAESLSSFDRGESGRTFAGRIGANEPVYFIYGTKAPAAKFQISFKYRLATFRRETETDIVGHGSLQFGYTQRSLWDTKANSSPFYDTSYQPEIMYESVSFITPNTAGPFSWYGFQAGLRHESNGQAGTASRTLNVAFARPVIGVGPASGWHLLLFPQIYEYLGTLNDNPRIKEYRGYGDIRGVFGRNDGPMLGFTANTGNKFNHQTYQFDGTIPVHTKLLDTSLFVLIQYFRGYGESLRAYDQKSDALRIGLSFVR